MGSTSQPSDNLMNIHVFLFSFTGQGHVNPLLRLGKLLAHSGVYVTFAATEQVGSKIRKVNNITTNEPMPCGRGIIRFEFFDDGWDFSNPNQNDLEAYMAHLELVGREKLPQAIKQQPELGRPPVTCLIHNPFIPWVSDVAQNLGIPSAVLWIQSAACFSVYYQYNNKLIPFPTKEDSEIDVRLPGMPILKHDEIPSFLNPSTIYPFLGTAILGQFKNLSNSFCVLIDTFQELESEIINSMAEITGLSIKPVGPLFKSMIASTDSIRADLIPAADDCTEFLDSQPARSVVYISFGSIVNLKQEQVDELAHGILSAGVPFLWVMRPPSLPTAEEHVLPEGFLEAVGKRGKVVKWSPQEKVLEHRSVACFVTHCGWNSTMEALGSGVPVVAFPQFGDQLTNAKFVVDVFRVGIQMCRGESKGQIVGRDDIEKCLKEATASEELRANALRWKTAAEMAVAEGGSSWRNMVELVDKIVGLTSTSKN